MAFFVFLAIITFAVALARGRVARWFCTVLGMALLVWWASHHPGAVRVMAIAALIAVMAFAALLDRLKSRRPSTRRR